MKALLIQLTLLEPVLPAAVGGGDPNSAVPLNYLPGSALRGAFIARYLQGRPVDAADETFRSLFFNPEVRFLHAYPMDSQRGRSLPTPLAWMWNKDLLEEERPIHHAAVRHPAEAYPSERASVWEIPHKPFCRFWPGSGRAELIEVETDVRIHIARQDRRNPSGEGSTIFRYEALAAGQTFVGAICAPDGSDLSAYQKLLKKGDVIQLGKSVGAGYGCCRVDDDLVPKENWDEFPRPSSAAAAGYDDESDDDDYESFQVPESAPAGELAVVLLSDLIARHPLTGAYTVDPEVIFGARPERAFFRTRLIGGFNRAWNLPTPQAPALQAGSVFVFQNSPELQARLSAWEEAGLGERRIEGYGRIAVDRQAQESFDQLRLPKTTPATGEKLTGEAAGIALRMTTRILRAGLDRLLVARINASEIQRPPQKAQLSRLRRTVARGLAEKSPQPVKEHLENLRTTARKQFEAARVWQVPFQVWINELLDSPDRVWSYLGSEVKLPNIGGIQPEREALALEYALRLVDGVLAKARKES